MNASVDWLRATGATARHILRLQVRRPSVWLISLAVALFGPLMAATALDPSSPDGSARWAESLAFGTLLLLGLILATTAAAASLADDVASGRAALLRTRRAGASTIVFGRWLGLWAFFAIWMSVTGLLSIAPTHWLVHQGSPWPTTRAFVTADRVDFAGRAPEGPGAPHVLAAGELGRIEFPIGALRRPEEVPIELAVSLRFARRAEAQRAVGLLVHQLPLTISVVTSDQREHELLAAEVPWQPRLRLPMPSDPTARRVTIVFQHAAPDAVLLLDPRDAQLYGGPRPAWLDRLQVAGGLTLMTGLILAAATFLSSAFSAPVALLGALGFFVLGQSAGWLEEIFDRLASGHDIGHSHGGTETWPALARALFFVLARVFGVCPDFRSFEFLDQMLSGQAILWTQLGSALGVLSLYGLPLLALGSIAWQRREIQ